MTFVLSLVALAAMVSGAVGLEPIPDKLVVLTFDDSAKSHYTTVRPILKRYGFGATFFITEGFDFPTNKNDYMTWEEIAALHRDGFEIGNHTGNHASITNENLGDLAAQLKLIDMRLAEHGIPRPTSFAYPGNAFVPGALPILKQAGIRFARRGGSPERHYRDGHGFAYEPGLDHPLLVPSAGDARPDWTLDDFIAAVEQARHGRVAVLQFHGVPDAPHGWVSTSAEQFDAYMNYLAKHEFKAVSMRDLARFVDSQIVPSEIDAVIEDRRRSLRDRTTRENFRRPDSADELNFWLENMLIDHGFSLLEASMATGLSSAEIAAAADRFSISKSSADPSIEAGAVLKLRPYPGGRHPRIGFLDGAIRPQRETKFSVFLPWDLSQYVVADIPEAVWMNRPDGRELLYLAHTHVPTFWSRQGIDLEPLEWTRAQDGSLRVERKFPNNVVMGAEVVPTLESVRIELWLSNGSSETLTGLAVQNCVMLKGAAEFNALNNDNKLFREPYVACRNAAGDRWIITAWENCARAWGNAPCPCMHSDPQFPDCPPGETRRLNGWLSFYQGTDIAAELRRIDGLDWREGQD
jgi:peptidoglycan/xylan/chitin deacetylase (PgdA/CDA1 family)